MNVIYFVWTIISEQPLNKKRRPCTIKYHVRLILLKCTRFTCVNNSNGDGVKIFLMEAETQKKIKPFLVPQKQTKNTANEKPLQINKLEKRFTTFRRNTIGADQNRHRSKMNQLCCIPR